MKKLNCILLVDDDEADNEYHSLVIEETQVTHSIKSAGSARLGIKYLASIKGAADRFVIPDLIFLDINMPGMNGFEFLQECREQQLLNTIAPVIIMLTTSVNPNDKIKAEEKFGDLIKGFRIKPLTEKMLYEIMEEYFDDNAPNGSGSLEVGQGVF